MHVLVLLASIAGVLSSGQNFATNCVPKLKQFEPSRYPCCQNFLTSPCVTASKSPGAGGAPSPCTIAVNTCVNPCKLAPSPIIFEECVQFKMAALRTFRWDVYSPRYNWFYDWRTWRGETPCLVFKLANNGIDVTLFSPDMAVPICSTLSNYEDIANAFNIINANSCEDGIRSENYALTCRRVAYGLNLISGCSQMRVVVLSKSRDEFPPGFAYRLVENPYRKCFNSTASRSTKISKAVTFDPNQ